MLGGGEFLEQILYDPIFLIAISIVLGKIIGKFSYKHFSLGSSAILFVGIILVEVLYSLGYTNVEIPSILFKLSLNSFVTVVALIAASSLVDVVKKYGVKFVFLALVVTSTAAGLIYAASLFLPDMVYHLTGVFVGALTSSPGFGNALEISSAPVDKSALVTIGYIIAYMPGVISVILFGRFAANSYKKQLAGVGNTDIKNEVESKEPLSSAKEVLVKPQGFDIVKLMIVVAVGMAIGSIKLSFGQGMVFSLGGTGGCLLSALVFGSFVKGFSFDETKLNVIKDISICSFLAIIGLRYGHRAVQSLLGDGLILFPIAIAVALLAIAVGYSFGKYVLKIETPLLAGGICGAMTSTPGLAATLEAFEDSRVVTGYGATYPFGLIFTILLIKLFI